MTVEGNLVEAVVGSRVLYRLGVDRDLSVDGVIVGPYAQKPPPASSFRTLFEPPSRGASVNPNGNCRIGSLVIGVRLPHPGFTNRHLPAFQAFKNALHLAPRALSLWNHPQLLSPGRRPGSWEGTGRLEPPSFPTETKHRPVRGFFTGNRQRQALDP